MKKYVQLFVALVTGDNAEANGIKNQNKAISLIKAQLAIKEAEKISLEEDVETAKEEQIAARLNGGELIGKNGSIFLQNLIDAQHNLQKAIEQVDNINREIQFFEEELAEINK